MTALAWYATGTVGVTNGSAVVTGAATLWMANADAGQGFIGPDFSFYEIASVDSDTHLTLRTNYRGTTVASGGAYVMPPIQGYTRSAAQQLAALMLAAASLINLAPNNNDIIQEKGGTWATRSPLQYFLDLCSNLTEVTVPSASTCDIGAATSPKVLISGSNTITSLGTAPNCHRWVRFSGALTLTHNAATLILPGGVNRLTAPGDTAIFASDGSGNWRCWNYTSGNAGGVSRLSPTDFGAIGDGTLHYLSAGDITAHPTWFGAYTTSNTWDDVGYYECLVAAFGNQSSVPGTLAGVGGTVVWNRSNSQYNRDFYLKNGKYCITKPVTIAVNGFNYEHQSRTGAALVWYGPGYQTMLTFDSASYGIIRNLCATTSAADSFTMPLLATTYTVPLVNIDYTGAITSQLRVQQLRVIDANINGYFLSHSVGLGVNWIGGSGAQGDTITFENCFFSGFNRAAVVIIGTNALSILFVGGDIQSCRTDGIAVYGGSVFVYGMNTENQISTFADLPIQCQITNFGADLHVFTGTNTTGPISISDLRCEGEVPVISEYTLASVRGAMNACGSPLYFTWGAANPFWGVGTPMADPTSGSNRVYVMVDEGGTGNDWRAINAGSSTATKIVDGPGTSGYTVNAWVGYTLAYKGYNGFTGFYPITANTATSVTIGTASLDINIYGSYKIIGNSGGSLPAFSSATIGRVTPHPVHSPGAGFTTTAGSTTVTVNTTLTPISANEYVIIPHAASVTMPSGFTSPAPLIAKVTAVTGTTITINKPAGAVVTDQMGYICPALTDGTQGMKWGHADFDAFIGASLQDIQLYFGRFRFCGPILNYQMRQGTQYTAQWVTPLRAHPTTAGTDDPVYLSVPSGSLDVPDRSQIWAGDVYLNGPAMITAGGVSSLRAVSGTNPTVNFQAVPEGYSKEATLCVTETTTQQYITWGSNCQPLRPYLPLGVGGRVWTAKFVFDGGIFTNSPSTFSRAGVWRQIFETENVYGQSLVCANATFVTLLDVPFGGTGIGGMRWAVAIDWGGAGLNTQFDVLVGQSGTMHVNNLVDNSTYTVTTGFINGVDGHPSTLQIKQSSGGSKTISTWSMRRVA